MTGIQDKRRAIRHLLREREPADAMAAYYALYHPDERTTLIVSPLVDGQHADGYVALSRTGIDLFRPLVTMRLPTDRDPTATEAAAALLRQALGPGQPVIISAPDRYLPLLRALGDTQSEERLRLYALDGRRFEPVINVLVTRGEGPGGLPRFTIRSSQTGTEEVAATASLNWQSPTFAEIAVSTRPQFRRQGWGRSVVAALCQYVLESGRTPLYVVAEENAASIQLAESLGFADTGAREAFLQTMLRPIS
ncbi:MAG TPA: GNAT family N-acetyltransferase [Promineifilum sp.]|nr:GNAT family N-acetyltransferase [Promineifilum sp.]HQF71104.1 GNAT family N-acetyltransferase [Promineifilum sp.]